MARIILVDDNRGATEIISTRLVAEGFGTCCADTGQRGLELAAEQAPDAAIIELRLPDMSGLEVLRGIRERSPLTACLVLTRFGTCRSAVEAMRLGATDFLEKPVSGDELVDALTAAIERHRRGRDTHPPFEDSEPHSLTRWADVVVRAIDAPTDPRTLSRWGRAVGASVGTLRNWCRTANLPARQSLHFTRMLRAVARHQATRTPPEHLLNVVDRRTLLKLLDASGGPPGSLPGSVEEYLERQRLIENRDAVTQVRVAMTRVGPMIPAAMSRPLRYA